MDFAPAFDDRSAVPLLRLELNALDDASMARRRTGGLIQVKGEGFPAVMQLEE
jgi:hypothetical protein